MSKVVNVGRAIVVLTLKGGKKVSFPIQGHYISRTTGPLDRLQSVVIPVSVNDEFNRLKDIWQNSKVVQHLSNSWKLEDLVNIELTQVSDFNLVVP